MRSCRRRRRALDSRSSSLVSGKKGPADMLRIAACALLALVFTLATYEAVAEKIDKRRYPAPGTLVDVGDHRLHIRCEGTGSGPTVIFESGAGSTSAAWRLVQPEVSKFARTCAYDRAGFGWSDSGRS